MSRRERYHPQPREIQSTFAPSRLRLSWLAQAYEQVVPIVRRTTSQPSRRSCKDAEERWRSEGPSPFGDQSQQRGARLA